MTNTTSIAVRAEPVSALVSHRGTPDSGNVDNGQSDSNQSDSYKTIVFAIADYWFALPVPAVLKVIRLEKTMLHEIDQNGFIMMGGTPLSVVDMRSQLTPYDQSQSRTHTAQIAAGGQSLDPPTPYLLVMQLGLGQTWALRVDRIPEMFDLPRPSIYPVLSTALQQIRAIARYMAILPPDASKHLGNRPIFLMNLESVSKSIGPANAV